METKMPYRYRLYTPDGDEAGEAHCAVRIQPDEIISTGDGRKLRVLDLGPEYEADSGGIRRVQRLRRSRSPSLTSRDPSFEAVRSAQQLPISWGGEAVPGCIWRGTSGGVGRRAWRVLSRQCKGGLE
jgi:hypothetical protein